MSVQTEEGQVEADFLAVEVHLDVVVDHQAILVVAFRIRVVDSITAAGEMTADFNSEVDFGDEEICQVRVWEEADFNLEGAACQANGILKRQTTKV